MEKAEIIMDIESEKIPSYDKANVYLVESFGITVGPVLPNHEKRSITIFDELERYYYLGGDDVIRMDGGYCYYNPMIRMADEKESKIVKLVIAKGYTTVATPYKTGTDYFGSKSFHIWRNKGDAGYSIKDFKKIVKDVRKIDDALKLHKKVNKELCNMLKVGNLESSRHEFFKMWADDLFGDDD